MPDKPGTFVDFRQIKQTVSMEQILARYNLLEALTPTRDGFTGPCPIHQGHNRTQFRVSKAKNCWRCFGTCNAGGNILDFVAAMEGGLNIREAALLIQGWFISEASPGASQERKVAAERKGAPPGRRGGREQGRGGKPAPEVQKASEEPQTAPEEAFNKPLGFTLTSLDPEHPYLKSRGLGAETIATFGLGYCSKGMFTGRIAIPIHDERGELVAYAGRWAGDPPEDKTRYKFPSFSKSLVLFNLHRVRAEWESGAAGEKRTLVVVEGFFDCIHLWQLGCRDVVAIMGSSLSEYQEKLIADTLGPAGQVILAFDEDEAGRAGCEQAVTRLARRLYVRVVGLGCEGRQPEDLSDGELERLLSGEPITEEEQKMTDTDEDIRCWREGEDAHFSIPQEIVFHSPTGMEWGYPGSGPADFALNILARFVDRERAWDLHQEFKRTFVAPLPLEGGTIRAAEIRAWLAAQEESSSQEEDDAKP